MKKQPTLHADSAPVFKLKLPAKVRVIALAIILLITFNLNKATAQTSIGPFNIKPRSENSLRSPFLFYNGPNPTFVDWDLDGDEDLVLGEFSSIRYYKNMLVEKGGGFDQQTGPNNPFNWFLDYSEFSPTFIDYDKDGDLDLFLGTSGTSTDFILYYKNVGGTLVGQSGPWDPANRTGNPLYNLFGDGEAGARAKITFIDLENDGDYDALIAKETSGFGLAYYRNDLIINGTEVNEGFHRESLDVGLPAFEEPDSAPLFTDLDQDNDLDLILGHDGGLRYFQNTGTNHFIELTSTENPFFDLYFSNGVPTVVDIDDDNDLDVFVGVTGDPFEGSTIAFLENTATTPGTLVFTQRTKFENPLDGFKAAGAYYNSDKGAHAAFIDVDNDLDMDLFIGDRYSSNLLFFRNNAGKYEEATNPLGTNEFTEHAYPVAVDITNDGFLDVFVAGQTVEESGDNQYIGARYFVNNGDGSFTEQTGVSNPLNNLIVDFPYDYLKLIFLDKDDDGYEDCFVYGRNSSASLFLHAYRFVPAAGSTPAKFQPDTDNNPMGPFWLGDEATPNTVDFDHDGDLDIVVGADDGSVRYFENLNNSEAFEEKTEENNPLYMLTSGSQTSPSFVDIDQDGDIDCFVNTIGGSFTFLKNENPAPELSTDYTTLRFAFSEEPIFFNPSFGLTDPDGDLLVEARITIDGFESGKDLLGYTGPDLSGDVSMYFNDASGVFTISGTTSLSVYQTALQGITYQYIHTAADDGDQRKKNPAGRTLTKTVRFEVFDLDRTNPAQVNFSLNHDNIAPSLTSATTTATFTSTSGAITLDNAITPNDEDDPGVSSATIQITGGFVSTEDRLEFNDPLGILTGTYLTGTGQFQISGQSSLTHYMFVLRSVRYNNVAAFPDFTPRTIQFTISDGEDSSTPHSVTVNFNLTPSIALSQSAVSYSGMPQTIDNGITILDDNSGITSATLTFSSGYVPAEDRLLFTNQLGITGIFDSVAGTLTLSGAATKTDYQTAIRSITYSNLSSTPTTTPRVISIALQDASSNTSNLVTLNVNFTSQNPPALSTTITSLNYITGALVVSNDFTVADSDDSELESATVTISTGYVATEDLLTVTPAGGITGSFDTVTGQLTLTGTSTLANYQTVLRSVTYQNTNTGDRNKNTRTLIFRVNDGTDNSNLVNIAVNLPNQTPFLTNTGATLQYASGSLLVADQVSLSDGDNATFQSATVQITSGFVSGEDMLLFTAQNGITGSFDNATGMMQLVGSSSIGNYQVAIRSVRYQNVNAGDRNKNSRTIVVAANDGIANSNFGTITLTIPNQAPSITAGPNPPLYGSGALAVFNGLTIADNDNATLQSATVSITSGLRSSEDQLIFSQQNGISATFTASTGILQLTGASSKANYETAIRSIQYQNSSSSPDPVSRIISVTINDGMTSSTAATITLGINQAPVIVVDEPVIGAGGSVNFNISELASDPDNNLDLNNINSITITAQPSSGAVASIVNGTLVVDYSAIPNFTGVDHLTLTICDNLNRCTSQEITIQVGAELEVYNAVSAFKDGYNDYFYLRYIEPDNKVTIFNRWGDKVFERVNYDNNDAGKRFEGLNDNGEKLPSGTYFYKVEYGSTLAASGYLTLKQ